MAVKQNVFSHPASSGAATPVAAADQALPVRTITVADLKDAVRLGWADFLAKPSHLVFVAIVYPLAGIFLAQLTVSYDIFPLLFPLMAGFALVGPFAAIGLYEISRRREKGLDSSWPHAFGVRRSPAIGSILVLGALLTGIFMAWLVAAYLIYNLTFGGVVPVSIRAFIGDVLTTGRGWALILLGNGVGLVFALAAFTLSVVSFPLLLDRKVSLAAAIRTSISAVRQNPVTLMLWGLFIALALVAGSLPLFVGLAIVMPVLAHASWHLYRKVVA
jgi:uncharacterized membrane protein